MPISQDADDRKWQSKKYDRYGPPQGVHPSALPKTYSFQNAAGNAKGHPYLPMGRELPGPDSRNRHGPRSVPVAVLENTWRGSGPLGQSVNTPFSTHNYASSSSVCSVPVLQGRREWADSSYNGVAAAAAYAKYIASGGHLVKNYADLPKITRSKPKSKAVCNAPKVQLTSRDLNGPTAAQGYMFSQISQFFASSSVVDDRLILDTSPQKPRHVHAPAVYLHTPTSVAGYLPSV